MNNNLKVLFCFYRIQGAHYPLTPNVVIQNANELETDILVRQQRGREAALLDDPTKVAMVMDSAELSSEKGPYEQPVRISIIFFHSHILHSTHHTHNTFTLYNHTAGPLGSFLYLGNAWNPCFTCPIYSFVCKDWREKGLAIQEGVLCIPISESFNGRFAAVIVWRGKYKT